MKEKGPMADEKHDKPTPRRRDGADIRKGSGDAEAGQASPPDLIASLETGLEEAVVDAVLQAEAEHHPGSAQFMEAVNDALLAASAPPEPIPRPAPPRRSPGSAATSRKPAPSGGKGAPPAKTPASPPKPRQGAPASGPPPQPGHTLPAQHQGSVPMPPVQRTTFTDMKERNDAELQRMLLRYYYLTSQIGQLGPQLPPDLQAELTALTDQFTAAGMTPPFKASTPTPQVDPLFKAIRDQLASMLSMQSPVGDPVDGVLPSQLAQTDLTDPEKALAAVYGLLETDNQTDPASIRFVGGMTQALGEYSTSKPLFDAVLQIMADEGQNVTQQLRLTPARGTQHIVASDVRANQWASVVRILRADGTQASDYLLKLKTLTALTNVVGGGDNAPPSSLSIDLPDLDAQSDLQIVADNIRAMQAIYFAAMLEELRMFQVVDKLVEQFQSGMLPLGKGNAGDTLYAYWKKSVNRLSEIERRNLYARTFGLAGGEPQVSPNREFSDLWLRFISAVSSFVRQNTLEDMLRSSVPVAVTQEQVRKSGMDLAANLSLHGYGVAYFAATELQTQIQEIIGLLSDPEVKTAYGARDMWQVIDQVATLELGGAKNSIRYRTMATAGAVIIRWLAERGPALSGTTMSTLLDVNQIRNPSVRLNGGKPLVSPTDRDLVDACDQYLAVTGTQEQSIEQYAQPVETPNQTSRPIQIPEIARDMLSSVGISTGLSSNGNYARR
jgi:hypothetical protein